jgi:predicted dehydrogenase
MTQREPIRWGVLGLGQIAREFAIAVPLAGGRLLAAGSRDQGKADAFAAAWGAERAYGSYEALLSDPEIDVIYLATPHNSHGELILECLNHGKHVLCEKVITTDAHQLRTAQELAQTRGLLVAEAMTIYHMPLFQELRSVIQSGQLGILKMIQAPFGSYKDADPANRFFNPELAGGALLDIGTYALSLMRFFLSSQPHRVKTLALPFATGVDESASIILENKQGELATISLTFRAKMPKIAVVAGDLGYITIDNYPRADHAAFVPHDGPSQIITAGQSSQALVYEAIAMQKAIQNLKADPDTYRTALSDLSADLSLDVLDLMDEIRRQWREA